MQPSSLAFSSSATRAVCHLTHLRCWVVPGRDSSSSAGSVRRVPSLHSSVSLRLAYTRPLFLHTSVGVNPSRSVPGSRDTAVPAVGADSVGTSPPQTAPERQCQATPSTFYLRSSNGPSRSRLVRPSPHHTLSVFVGVWEPKVSQPLRRQSPPTLTHQTASPATLRFAPCPMALPDSQPPHKATLQTPASVRLDSTIG